MHGIFPNVVLHGRGDLSQESFRRILSNVEEMNDADWGNKSNILGKVGTSKKTVSTTVEGFARQLKEALSR